MEEHFLIHLLLELLIGQLHLMTDLEPKDKARDIVVHQD